MLPYAWIAEFATYLGHIPIVDFATTARTLQAIRADLMLTPNTFYPNPSSSSSFRTTPTDTVTATNDTATNDQENDISITHHHTPMFAPAAGPYTQYSASSQSSGPAYAPRRRLPFTPIPRLN